MVAMNKRKWETGFRRKRSWILLEIVNYVLYFEEKWFEINKRRILLHSDAIPTKFGKDLTLSKRFEII